MWHCRAVGWWPSPALTEVWEKLCKSKGNLQVLMRTIPIPPMLLSMTGLSSEMCCKVGGWWWPLHLPIAALFTWLPVLSLHLEADFCARHCAGIISWCLIGVLRVIREGFSSTRTSPSQPEGLSRWMRAVGSTAGLGGCSPFLKSSSPLSFFPVRSFTDHPLPFCWLW